MSSEYPSAAELEVILPFLPINQQVNFKYMFATEPEEVVTLINKKIDLIKNHMEKDSRNYRDMSEDEISSILVTGLTCSGFDADHDSARSGHVDIIVKHPRTGIEWYAEAKIWKGVRYLSGGFDQLFTRYCSNNPGWENGAIFVYYKDPAKMSDVRDKWKGELSESQIINCPLDDKSSFITRHSKVATGTPYNIRHTFFSLFYDPKK